MRTTIHVVAQWAAIGFGAVSAGLWFWAARVGVPDVTIASLLDGMTRVIGKEKQDEALKKLSRINAGAAFFAGCAALAQTVAQLTDPAA